MQEINIKNITETWEKIIKIQNADPDATFFDLGGHSLLMIDLVEEVNEKYGTDVDVISLMENPTVSTFTEFLAKQVKPNAS